MMNSDFAPPVFGTAAGYATVESLLNEAASSLRRHSRCSMGQRTTGSMRVVKPSSTSNSPRGAVGLARRRTVMTDRRRMVVVDQRTGAFVSNDGLQLPTKPSRPVSWHPSSHLGHQQVPQSSNPISYMNTSSDFHIFDLPPTPVAYSGYASPNSTFSPVSGPYTGHEDQYSAWEPLAYESNRNYAYPEAVRQHIPNYLVEPSDDADPNLFSHFDWSSFPSDGLEKPTIPLTPNFLPIQHPEPTFPSDEAIPYHSLSDPAEEEEGEILCGMGLYDNPDSGKSTSFDPQLDTYRSSMWNQLLGPTYGREPTGKGLKLEETWSPPASEDGNDNDNEQDGEGEDDDNDDDDAAGEDEICEDGQTDNITLIQGGSVTNAGSSNFAVLNQDRIHWL